MKRQPPHSEVKNGLTAVCYRQTASKSVTGYHEMPPERFDIVVEMESSREFIDSQQHSGFRFSTIVDRSSLSKLVKEKNIDEFAKLGGVEGIGTSLETDGNNGIKGDNDEILCRTLAFGANTYSLPPTKSFSRFVCEALKNPTIVILLVCAALLLGFGIKVDGLKEGWYDGGGILIALLIVAFINAINNFRQKRLFNDHHVLKVSNGIQVEVVRDGRRQNISIFGVVVGDVVCLKIGDQVPADGLFIEGYSLLVDESSMTGESYHVEINGEQNPFLFSGTKVADGYAKMLVTAVGMNTYWGEMMSIIGCDSDEQTPLQVRLNKLTSLIGKVGLAVAFLVLAVLSVRYFTGYTEDENGNKEFNGGSENKVDNVINAVVGIIAVVMTIVVVAIPGGLSLAVTLTLDYSMSKMMSDQALVRKLSACETLGSVTTICTDIPHLGTATSNKLKVTKFFIGTESMEGISYTSIAPKVLDQLFHGISLARESVHKLFAVTQVDDAIHLWSVIKQNMEFESARDFSILGVEASCPEKKRIGVVVKNKTDETVHVYWRGNAERIISSSSHCLDTAGNITVLDEKERERLQQILENMAASGLVCIGYAHKQVSQDEYENEKANQKIPDKGLILSGYVGLKVPHHPGIKEAVEFCQVAGVSVKIITSENVLSAKSVARECGLISSDEEELVVEGAQFRHYTEDERMKKVEKISVMGRSSPSDKLLLVQSLRSKGHVVAVTGNGTHDVPTLMEADIGVLMGIQGTEVAKENSDIVILDDNFASVVTTLRWGRSVYTNIQKFIQFQLTVNVVALTINFVAAISTGKTPMSAVQLLWVNLIMDTLAAFVLATETPSISPAPPMSRAHPIISNIMWRNILGQASYQIAAILLVMFKSKSIFGDHHQTEIDTIIFNTFVLLQVFNLVNARKLEEKNVFEGIIKNKMFLWIVGVTIIFQVVMVQFLNKLCHTKSLNLKEWGACIGIAIFSWPIGWLVKFIPVHLIWWSRESGNSCKY